jgi:hypothetical protein
MEMRRERAARAEAQEAASKVVLDFIIGHIDLGWALNWSRRKITISFAPTRFRRARSTQWRTTLFARRADIEKVR